MPDLTDLDFAAREVIRIFNAATSPGGSYDPLKHIMDSSVILKKVLHPGSVTGIGNVIGYLDNHMKDTNPQLLSSDGSKTLWNNANPIESLTLIPADASQARYGRATGTGFYSDSPQPSKIRFTLDFVRESTNDKWSLSNSFSTPIP